MDQAFLIDVSEEDDSLLPAANNAMHRNGDHPQKSSSGSTAEAVGAIQNDNLLCQEVSNGNPKEPGNLALPAMTEEPVLVKKKKKTGFNVRKSLAWNNAFLTEEGVLDSEELSLVNRTFQLPHGLPKSSTLKKPIQALKPVKPPMMPKISLTSHNTALTAESKEIQKVPPVINSTSSSDPNRILHGTSTPIPLANVHIDTSKKEKALVEAIANSSEAKLLLRRSIEKKDQGSSLPGINRYNTEHHSSVVETDSNVQAAMAYDSVSSKRATNLKQPGKERKGISQSTNKEAIRQFSLMKSTGNPSSLAALPQAQPAPSSIKLISDAASSKTQYMTKKSTSFESGTFACRDKPSGLRMPSPKLGFFDSSRTTSQVAVQPERTSHGHGINGLGRSSKNVEIGNARYAMNQNQGLKQPAASAKPSHQLLEASRKQTIEIRSSSSIPATSHVHGHGAGIASMKATSVQGLSRSVSYPSNQVNKKADRIEQVLQTRKNGQNGSMQGKLARSQPGNSVVRNVPGQENLSPDGKDGKGMLQKCVVAQGLALGNPNIKTFDEMSVNEAVQECKEMIAESIAEPSPKSVTQLSSSTHGLQ